MKRRHTGSFGLAWIFELLGSFEERGGGPGLRSDVRGHFSLSRSFYRFRWSFLLDSLQRN